MKYCVINHVNNLYRLHRTYQEFGALERPRPPRVRPVVDGPLRAQVVQRFENEEILSARRAAREMGKIIQNNEHIMAIKKINDSFENYVGIHRESLRKMLKEEEKMKPYKPQLHQRILDLDRPKRLDFANWATTQELGEADFARHILFTDEATFTERGSVNKQNLRQWRRVNPRWTIARPQRGWKVNVWAGIFGDRIIGPIFYDVNMTGTNNKVLYYLRF